MVKPAARPKVTIDVAPLLEDQWTGIPVFTRRLIQALQQDGRVELEFCCNYSLIPSEHVNAAIKIGTGAFLKDSLANAARAPKLVDPGSHLFFPSVKPAWDVSRHEASTVHDMSTLFMPENHEEANIAYHLDHLKNELASDEVVFCVSEATREALLSAFPSVGNKARVLYQYVDWPEEFALLDENMPPLNLGRYAAVIGTIEPRKNLTLLINAMPLPEIADSGLKFIVIGKKGWLVDKFLADLTPEQREKLVFSGFVSEFIKYRLLKNAEFLVFPSLYEGFGIPALEALSLGKPVLASRTSSFPEVIGDAGLYFDPLSTTDFAACLAEFTKPKLQAELASRALAQSRLFGPARMAEPIIEWVSA
ncbi:glycosyltransferase family 4 protein [Bradyrhizobium sp. HKCCYLR20261]|uniref:glycosyltransferase family 4 protein n=1 Tax=Bradyrhizobium sp. HKCCYLR20261 TaxID=3420760 RepID=UPI003EB9B5A7